MIWVELVVKEAWHRARLGAVAEAGNRGESLYMYCTLPDNTTVAVVTV